LVDKSATVNAHTLKGYSGYLAWLTKHFGNDRTALIEIRSIVSHAGREQWSDTHRHNVLWCINAFLRWCGRTEKIPLPPKASRGAETVISDETHRAILAETKGDFRALCQFLWLTGCRPSEATSLTSQSVNWEHRTIALQRHKTRHKGKTRILHLSRAAAQILEDQSTKYRGDGLLFRGLGGKPFSLQAMTMRFQRLSERIGQTVTSYCYRHTFATRALAAGESDTVVAGLLGHASTQMIHKAYSHISEQGRALRDAADRIGA
jgi:integrase